MRVCLCCVLCLYVYTRVCCQSYMISVRPPDICTDMCVLMCGGCVRGVRGGLYGLLVCACVCVCVCV